MSGVHFEVQNLGTHTEVHDLGSTNGTWLNDQKVLAEQLRDGDRLRAGKTVLTVEILRAVELASPQGLISPDRSVTWIPPAVVPPASYPTPPDRPAAWDEEPQQGTPSSVQDDRHASPERKPAPPLPPLRPSEDRPVARPLTPFDSIDFGDSGISMRGSSDESPPLPPEGFAAVPRSPQRDVSTPFDESSISLPGIPPHLLKKVEADGQRAEAFQFLSRRTTVDAADALAIVLDSLSQRWSVQAVVHFQKIRSPLPGVCPGTPLFQWLAETVAVDYSPYRMGWNEVQSDPNVVSMLPRLCRADACVAFLGETAAGVGEQIDEMVAKGLESFSEPGGLLPVYWPSCLATMLDVHGQRGCAELFGDRISGAIMCSAWNRKCLLAVARPSLQLMLEENGFSPTTSLSQQS